MSLYITFVVAHKVYHTAKLVILAAGKETSASASVPLAVEIKSVPMQLSHQETQNYKKQTGAKTSGNSEC